MDDHRHDVSPSEDDNDHCVGCAHNCNRAESVNLARAGVLVSRSCFVDKFARGDAPAVLGFTLSFSFKTGFNMRTLNPSF